MIPDHLTNRAAAAHAEYIGNRAQADGFFMPIKRGQLPLPQVAIEAMERALSAVAAEIWEQGYQAGAHDEWEYQHDVPDTGMWRNPYPNT